MPIEFVGIASHALLSFASDPSKVAGLESEIFAITIGWWVAVEFLYHVVMPYFKDRKISDKNGTVVVVFATIMLVFMWTQILFTASHYIQQIN